MVSPHSLRLIERLQQKKQQIRLLEADIADIILEMDQSDVAKNTGHNRLPALIAEALHIDGKTAARMIAHAMLVAEELTPTGHTTPAPLPTVRAALRDGVVDSEHIKAVADIVAALPVWVSTQDRELVEATLAETARVERPSVVTKYGHELLNRINQDGHDPHQEQRLAEPNNRFSYRRTAAGRIIFKGELEPESAEVFEGMLLEFSKPEPPAPGIEDPRSLEQRFGDAMSDIIDFAANPNPKGGTTQPRMIVTMNLAVLTDAVGTATLDSGAHLCPSAVRRLACEANLIPVVFKGAGVPIDRGRAKRLVSHTQRDLLIARDKGCAMPGCTRPPRVWRVGGGDFTRRRSQNRA